MTSNDDNAYMTASATGDWGWGHPLYMMSLWNGFSMSKTMENILKHESTVVDPRMTLWFGQTQDYVAAKRNGDDTYDGEQFSGLPNGMNATEIGLPENNVRRHSVCLGLQAYPDWNSQTVPDEAQVLDGGTVTLPLKIMTYGEVCLLKAEAALLGWNGAGDAGENYKEGIKASLADERSFLSDASLSPTDNDETYMTTGNVAWNENDSQEQKLEKLLLRNGWLSIRMV